MLIPILDRSDSPMRAPSPVNVEPSHAPSVLAAAAAAFPPSGHRSQTGIESVVLSSRELLLYISAAVDVDGQAQIVARGGDLALEIGLGQWP